MTKGSSYDTRFLVELYYSSDQNLKARIKETLLRSKPNYMSTAVLSEIYKLTLEKEGKDVAEIRWKSLSKDFHLVDVNPEIAVGAALIKHKHQMPFVDSIVAATAKVLRVPCYTDDPHFEPVEGLSIKWIS